MKIQIIQTVLFLLVSTVAYTQFSYQELVSLRKKTKNEVTNYLNTNKSGWSYLKYSKEKDRHIWKKGSDKLLIDYFATNSRIIKYFTSNLEYCSNISGQAGKTLEFEFPYKIDYDNEGLQIFKGSKYYLVVHTICTITDPECDYQTDIMTKSRFISEKY